MKKRDSERAHYGITVGRDLHAENVAAGKSASINVTTDDGRVAAEIAALRSMIAQLPGREAAQAAEALGRVESAAEAPAEPKRTAAISGALKDIETAAESSVGVLGAAEKIVAIVARLGKLLLL